MFARARFQGNQLAVFPESKGLTDEEMQALAQEMHFSETTFILEGDTLAQRRVSPYPVRIFTPAREVVFAGHPVLGTAYVIWDRFLNRSGKLVKLDLAVGTVPVEVVNQGERFIMTQPTPEFGRTVKPERIGPVLGMEPDELDGRYPAQEVSTGLWFLIVPVKHLKAVQSIKVNLAAYYRLIDKLQAKAVLVFCPETVDPEGGFHVRVFCDYYDVPEDPATGSANGCLCAWLVKHRYLGTGRIAVRSEQGLEINRPSQLYLEGDESSGRITVKVGGEVVPVGQGVIE